MNEPIILEKPFALESLKKPIRKQTRTNFNISPIIDYSPRLSQIDFEQSKNYKSFYQN